MTLYYSGRPYLSPLTHTHPELAAQWHPSRNGMLTPEEVEANSRLKVWWKCAVGEDHEWETQVVLRARANKPSGCPFCSNNKVCVSNSLAALHPTISEQWHPTRNASLTPATVTAHSNRKVWWLCNVDTAHEWQAGICDRTKGSTGCPYCSGRLATPATSLAVTYPHIAALWHPSLNPTLTPQQVKAGSSYKVWWQCPKVVDHTWFARISHLTLSGSGCPYCAGQKVTTSNSLKTLYPELATQWHPSKNGTLTPEQVVPGSTKKVWWTCEATHHDPSHDWQAMIDNRVKGHGCPFCVGRRAVPGQTSLAALHPNLINEWHPSKNGELMPQEVRPGSGKKVWWLCKKDDSHQWQAVIKARVKNESGCPYCSGRVANVASSLGTLFPEVAAQWHPTKNMGLRPDQVRPASARIVWWQCSVDPRHEWRTSPGNRTNKTRATECPYCTRGWTGCIRSRPFATSYYRYRPTKNIPHTRWDNKPTSIIIKSKSDGKGWLVTGRTGVTTSAGPEAERIFYRVPTWRSIAKARKLARQLVEFYHLDDFEQI